MLQTKVQTMDAELDTRNNEIAKLNTVLSDTIQAKQGGGVKPVLRNQSRLTTVTVHLSYCYAPLPNLPVLSANRIALGFFVS